MPEKIIVIGGGPAGMTAAIRAAELGRKVMLLEKGESLGRKLCLSGQGRGNFTNSGDIDNFLENFNQSGQFLRNAFSRFFNRQLIDFLEKAGLPHKTERQGRVFPQSDKAADILKVLERSLAKARVEIVYGRMAQEILVEGKTVAAVKLDNGQILPAAKVILAAGGSSFARTGSCGDGQRMAQKLGHTIIPLRPALVPLVTQEKWARELAGLTLRNVKISLLVNQKKTFSKIGELLFTHFGISGPVALSFSGDALDFLREKKEVALSIDLKPGLSIEMLDKRFVRTLKGSKILKNLLKEFLPQSLIAIFIKIAKIEPGRKASQVSGEERRRIVSLMKELRLKLAGSLPLEEAMVTRGGVSTKEINPKTMQSRLITGLYFAGELIDVDGKTGGYNLQAAFSTGYLAGENAAK